MTTWSRTVKRFVGSAAESLSKRLPQRTASEGSAVIMTYRGWGSTDQLYLKARILSRSEGPDPSVNDPWWRNALAILRRFASRELPQVAVRLQLNGAVYRTTSDVEGYAAVVVPHTDPATGWVRAEWSFEDVRAFSDGVFATDAFVPPKSARFGVISDLDDTVLRTGITKRMTMISTTFFNNAHTRVPFEGVAAFYRALHAGGQNPIFYVSTSPWNLYDLIDEFLRLRQVPVGPLFLTDWGLDRRTFIQPDSHAHKLNAIHRVLDELPDLPFVLIGDAGQHDPEIYRDAVHAHPGRIRAVYIRTLNTPARDASLGIIARELAEVGVPLICADETLPAAVHAAQVGFITAADVDALRTSST